MSDTRPNDHDHPALSHDLADHVGNTDEFPPSAPLFVCEECGQPVPDDVSLGEHYGYPVCCELDFCAWLAAYDLLDGVGYGGPNPRPERVLDGSGFVPCATHDVVFSAAEIVDQIGARRQCAAPFQAPGWVA